MCSKPSLVVLQQSMSKALPGFLRPSIRLVSVGVAMALAIKNHMTLMSDSYLQLVKASKQTFRH